MPVATEELVSGMPGIVKASRDCSLEVLDHALESHQVRCACSETAHFDRSTGVQQGSPAPPALNADQHVIGVASDAKAVSLSDQHTSAEQSKLHSPVMRSTGGMPSKAAASGSNVCMADSTCTEGPTGSEGAAEVNLEKPGKVQKGTEGRLVLSMNTANRSHAQGKKLCLFWGRSSTLMPLLRSEVSSKRGLKGARKASERALGDLVRPANGSKGAAQSFYHQNFVGEMLGNRREILGVFPTIDTPQWFNIQHGYDSRCASPVTLESTLNTELRKGAGI
jgi:hypothetical protein